MRDGVPLPGLSPAAVLSQLVHRVFGPLAAHRARMVLDYHGLAGHPAAPLTDIAARRHVTPRTVSARVSRVRAAGARLPLTQHLIGAVSRPSTGGEDHLGRTRIATTLALPAPNPPARPAPTRTAVLAAASRSRRFRQRTPLSAEDLAAALTAAGSTPGPDGRWHPPPGVTAPARYRAIVDAAAGRDLTRHQVIDILTAAGYRATSAAGRLSSSHPLFHRTGRNRYRVIGEPTV